MPRIGRYENPCLTVEFHRDLPAWSALSSNASMPAGGGGRDAANDATVAWLREKGF